VEAQRWRPLRKDQAPSEGTLMAPFNRNPRCIASRRLTRAVTLLTRVSEHLEDASRLTQDRYNSNRLRYLATGLRDLPLTRLASGLEKDGAL
jgi:hypothetical protein